jgi:large subunit ribosomal protein L29
LELSELRQMSAADLRIKEHEAREEVFKLRLKLRTNQLESRTNYYNARRELARIMTLIQEQAAGAARAQSDAASASQGSSARKG